MVQRPPPPPGPPKSRPLPRRKPPPPPPPPGGFKRKPPPPPPSSKSNVRSPPKLNGRSPPPPPPPRVSVGYKNENNKRPISSLPPRTAPNDVTFRPSTKQRRETRSIRAPVVMRDVDAFEKKFQVGEGTYGSVFVARDRSSNEIVALKRINTEQEENGFPITALREVKLLKGLKHPNMVLLKEIVCSKGTYHSIEQFVLQIDDPFSAPLVSRPVPCFS